MLSATHSPDPNSPAGFEPHSPVIHLEMKISGAKPFFPTHTQRIDFMCGAEPEIKKVF